MNPKVKKLIEFMNVTVTIRNDIGRNPEFCKFMAKTIKESKKAAEFFGVNKK